MADHELKLPAGVIDKATLGINPPGTKSTAGDPPGHKAGKRKPHGDAAPVTHASLRDAAKPGSKA
jgi:hypothetical protein